MIKGKYVGMQNKKEKNFKPILYISVFGHLLLSVFNHSLPSFSGYYYRGILCVEVVIVLAVVFLFRGRFGLASKEYIRLIVIFILQLEAYFITSFWGTYQCFDLHRLLIFLAMLFATYSCAQNAYISSRDFDVLIKIILAAGVGSCVYEFIQNREILSTFSLKVIMIYTSRFTSFFSSRSNYCLFLTCCFCLCLYKFEETRKKCYVLLATLYAFSIFLTNARTSIIVIIAILLFNAILLKKKTKIIAVLSVTLVLFFLPWGNLLSQFENFYNKYTLLFMHAGKNDISNGRFDLWATAISDVNVISFFIGHGIGSKDAFLTAIGNQIKSFHSSWVDLFYEMGVVGILIYLYIAYKSIYATQKSNLSNAKKKLIYDFYIALALCGVGDSVALPFLLDSSAVFTTLIFISCPICLLNGCKYEENENEKIICM